MQKVKIDNIIYAPYAFVSNESLFQTYRHYMKIFTTLPIDPDTKEPEVDDELNKTLDWLEAEIEDRYHAGKLRLESVYSTT
jgi:hypothetical protein